MSKKLFGVVFYSLFFPKSATHTHIGLGDDGVQFEAPSVWRLIDQNPGLDSLKALIVKLCKHYLN